MTFCSFGETAAMNPISPLSLPEMIITLSPRRIFSLMGLLSLLISAFVGIYRTSGASDTIFMKFRSRSSRATGPKIRVPHGPLGSHDDGSDDVALLDRHVRGRRLDAGDDDVADAAVARLGPLEHAN